MTTTDTGRSPSGSGHSPSGLSQSSLSQAQPSVPNAARLAAMIYAYCSIPSVDMRDTFPDYTAARNRGLEASEFFEDYARQIPGIAEFVASAIEAATAGETPKSGSTEGESAVPNGETPKGDHP